MLWSAGDGRCHDRISPLFFVKRPGGEAFSRALGQLQGPARGGFSYRLDAERGREFLARIPLQALDLSFFSMDLSPSPKGVARNRGVS